MCYLPTMPSLKLKCNNLNYLSKLKSNFLTRNNRESLTQGKTKGTWNLYWEAMNESIEDMDACWQWNNIWCQISWKGGPNILLVCSHLQFQNLIQSAWWLPSNTIILWMLLTFGVTLTLVLYENDIDWCGLRCPIINF